MESLEEFEAEFADSSGAEDRMIITHGLQTSLVSNVVRGKDFLAGVQGESAIAIPLHAISHALGSGLPVGSDTNLNQFLSMQKTPVRLEYKTGDTLSRCWLLNVLEDWLRVATTQGVGWIPIKSLQLVRIDPVDN